MIILETVIGALKADAQLSAIVGARIYASQAAQNAALPCIVADVVSDTLFERYLDRKGSGHRAALRIKCIADGYKQRLALGDHVERIINALESNTENILRSEAEGPASSWDDDTEHYTAALDAEIDYNK